MCEVFDPLKGIIERGPSYVYPNLYGDAGVQNVTSRIPKSREPTATVVTNLHISENQWVDQIVTELTPTHLIVATQSTDIYRKLENLGDPVFLQGCPTIGSAPDMMYTLIAFCSPEYYFATYHTGDPIIRLNRSIFDGFQSDPYVCVGCVNFVECRFSLYNVYGSNYIYKNVMRLSQKLVHTIR